METKHKAVVLGNNYYIGLSIIRSLGKHGVPVAVVDYQEEGAYARHSKYVTEKLIGPHYKKEADKFKDFLIGYAKNQDHKPVLYPSADPYVEFIDTYLDELKEFYLINQTEQGFWSDLIDKDKLYILAQQHNVRVPKTIQVKQNDVVGEVERDLGYPCIIKPSDSSTFVSTFRKKLFKVTNRGELEEGLKKVKDAGIEVVVQQLVQGFDDHMYTFDAYLNQDSKVTHWVTAQKERQYPINFGASVYIKQKFVPELHEIGAPFLEAIGYKGFAEIEFKKDEKTGEYYLIEINVRTTNFNQMLTELGFNMPLLAYKELTEQEIGQDSLKETTDLAFHYMYEDLHASRAYVKSGQLSWKNILKTYTEKRVGSIWARSDPKPGLYYVGGLANKVKNKIVQR
ncbi:Predicted ATP-dependent carboligase, ATP-grasp superfamily [Alkalibacterium subtropicum]|uniref:Predicted ATP-dependent carboligase, ATP-grasp superfamily n=1 Tax=Alkalibacterium subtropicum TaxID=753702 RepID=A0A1I1L7Q5_9LACT|nr:carboxylate--amine ligase [Alkalibacterium subtropicum]SFC69021.1 Predicted ATP-dependent carboligase, ATP-grasp superfamily [Alkalibacterium subtropicum]